MNTGALAGVHSYETGIHRGMLPSRGLHGQTVSSCRAFAYDVHPLARTARPILYMKTAGKQR